MIWRFERVFWKELSNWREAWELYENSAYKRNALPVAYAFSGKPIVFVTTAWLGHSIPFLYVSNKRLTRFPWGSGIRSNVVRRHANHWRHGRVLASGGRPARARRPAERDRSSAARQYNYYRTCRKRDAHNDNNKIYVYNVIRCTILYVYRTPISGHVGFLRVRHTSTNIMARVFIDSRAIRRDPVARAARAKQWPLACASDTATAPSLPVERHENPKRQWPRRRRTLLTNADNNNYYYCCRRTRARV